MDERQDSPASRDQSENALKALRWRRAAARAIDSLVGLILVPAVLLPVALGQLPPPVFAGTAMAVSLWYLASDRFPLGKRIMKLAVVDAKTKAPCTLNQSMTRNLTFGLRAVVQGGVALVVGTSWKAFSQAHSALALGIDAALFGVALYEAAQVDKGRPRLGDRWAGTTLVDLRTPVST